MREEEKQQQLEMSEEEEEKMQQLRSKATEFLLREEWKDSIEIYTNFISASQDYIFRTRTHQNPDPHNFLKQQKSLCLALSNRAEARFRLREYTAALKDCDEALKIESSHFKTLICKGKILFGLNRYGPALDCFRAANLDPQATVDSENLTELLERCKKLEFLSKTGSFDLSDWILNGFREKIPELPEYIGPVEIKISGISGRGLFTTKNIDTGTVLLATRAIATERGILSQEDSGDENAQLVMWKNLVDKVVESATKCSRTNSLINLLSAGENEIGKEVVPQVSLFGPEADDNSFPIQKVDIQKILSILDVNSLVEDSISSKVLGKYSGYYGVGLWLLASFINHSCDPNVRRLHIGDHVIIHASRDIKAGEEVTFAYLDILQPLHNRQEEAKKWGFGRCSCRRCSFEEGLLCHKQEMKEVETVLGKGIDMGGVVYRLEEGMKRWMVRGKGKGYLRASFWEAYGKAYQSEKVMRKWGRKIPAMETVVDSVVVDAVGTDHRVVKVFLESLNTRNGHIGGMVEMEKGMKFGRGIYGKTMKKQALKTLLQL